MLYFIRPGVKAVKRNKLVTASIVTSAGVCLLISYQSHLKNRSGSAPKTSIPDGVEKVTHPQPVEEAVAPKEYIPEKAGPLTEAEKKVFFEGIEDVFEAAGGRLDSGLDEELMALNLKGIYGVDAIVGELEAKPTTDQQVVNRLHLVSYLRYRCQFDPETRERVRLFLLEEVNTLSNKEKGVMYAERAEVLGGLAKSDWSKALDVLKHTKDRKLRELMAYEAYYGLKDKSGKRYAFDTVNEVVPDFPLPPGERPK